MKKINFDIVMENSSENHLNRDFGQFFNIIDLNDTLFSVKLIEDVFNSSKINDDFSNVFGKIPKKLNQIERFHHSKHNSQDFNFSFGVRSEKVSYEDINLSFNSLFGQNIKDDENKNVDNFFRKIENSKLQVEFNENFDKDIFLKLNENFESFFDCEKVELVVSPIPQMNFDIFRENVSLDFKTLNHEFSSYFPKLEEIPQNKNVKQLKESLEEVQDAKVVCDFNLKFIEESFDKLEFNQDFENFFNVQTDNLVSENSVVKALDIDLTKRRVSKESLETFKSDPLEFFVPEFSSKSKLKDEIVKETDQIIDNKIEDIEEKYNSILNSELDQMQKNHQKNIDSLKQEHDRKLTNMMNEFNLFKKMMLEQMSSVKSTFLSATSGGGAVNILDMRDIDKSNIQDGYTLSYNSTSRKFEFTNLETAGVDASVNEAVTNVFDRMTTDVFTIEQIDLDRNYLDLSEPTDPNYLGISEVQVNGQVTIHGQSYDFLSNTRIDTTNLNLQIGDIVRVFYIKS